jgi:hypothetical protein
MVGANHLMHMQWQQPNNSLMLRNTVAPPSACKLSNLILKQQPHLINVLTIAKIASS